ncbi:MAG: SIS domain-containing protein [Anaerolineae bacterium]|nr:SIS domain-containing protein [Anaerolineae bacterium]HRA55107.1 SIS domain-containing protein [Thermoflexales bacterium]
MTLPQLVILAGGLGTRLRGVVDDRPKPMALVHGRPFLERLLAAFRAQGFTRALICAGYRAEMIQAHFGEGGAIGMTLSYSLEPEGALLGTAGALRHAAPLLEPTFMLVNGDTYLEADLAAFSERCAPGEGCTVGLIRVPDAGRYGAVELAADGAITRFAEKSSAAEGLINAGVYVVDRAVLDDFPNLSPLSLERDVFPGLASRGMLRGVILDGTMIDIGTPDSYAAFQFSDMIADQLKESAQVKLKTIEACGPAIARAAQALVACYRAGGQTLWCGNGGSAADAQHLVGELVSKLTMERKALPAIALGTNSSIISAIANDYAYDQVFVRQVEAFTRPGDVLIAISTSGNSASVREAVLRARTLGATVIGLTGRGGGALAPVCDIAIVVPSDSTQRIQETHIAIGHILCDAVEKGLFSS